MCLPTRSKIFRKTVVLPNFWNHSETTFLKWWCTHFCEAFPSSWKIMIFSHVHIYVNNYIFSSITLDYSCALQRDILVHGRLYVSQSWLCFYANIFGWETLVSLNILHYYLWIKTGTVSNINCTYCTYEDEASQPQINCAVTSKCQMCLERYVLVFIFLMQTTYKASYSQTDYCDLHTVS